MWFPACFGKAVRWLFLVSYHFTGRDRPRACGPRIHLDQIRSRFHCRLDKRPLAFDARHESCTERDDALFDDSLCAVPDSQAFAALPQQVVIGKKLQRWRQHAAPLPASSQPPKCLPETRIERSSRARHNTCARVGLTLLFESGGMAELARVVLFATLLCCPPGRALGLAGQDSRALHQGMHSALVYTSACGIAERRLLRLRGAGDMSDAPVVDTRPAQVQPSRLFEEDRACAAGEEALAAAEQALAEGDFASARRLQQDAARAFSRQLNVAKWYDALWELHDKIDRTEREMEAARQAAEAAPPAFWSVSRFLNLTSQQVSAIEEWTRRPLQADRVLYLASEHGFDSRAFHHRCDNKGPTVTLVRTETGHIFGGYASVPWSRGELKTKPPRWVPTYVEDPEAFVFRLCAPSNWVGKGYDEVFNANYTKEVVEPYYSFRRSQERKAQRMWTDAHAPNASQEAKDALADSIYENYTQGMFWSKFDEDEVEGAPGAWTHEGAMIDGEDKAAPLRWGLDVKVGGISNSTGAMTDDEDVASQECGDGYRHGSWEPPVRLLQSGAKGLGDIPPLRHVWNKGPSFTHALELDLDVPENSFSDLCSGYIFGMPPGVPDEEERLFLAGKIGGRILAERLRPECGWDIAEVAVVSV